MHVLEFNPPVTSSPVSLTDELREFIVRDKRKFNVIVHGVLESISSDISYKTTGDKKSFTEILSQLFNTMPDGLKIIRLDKNIFSNPRPIKIILKNHDVASKYFSAFHFIK